jgi:hypothetical protein
MNEKIKKIFVGIGLVAGAVLAFLLGRGWNNPLRKRVSDTKDIVDNSRRTVDAIGAGNKQLEESAERAGQSVGNAHESVKRGIAVLEEAEKRSRLE